MASESGDDKTLTALTLPDEWVQTCFACKYASYTASGGTHCLVFAENILSEKVSGRDCLAFEADDDKTYVRVDS